jgi:hypothetical protein
MRRPIDKQTGRQKGKQAGKHDGSLTRMQAGHRVRLVGTETENQATNRVILKERGKQKRAVTHTVEEGRLQH